MKYANKIFNIGPQAQKHFGMHSPGSVYNKILSFLHSQIPSSMKQVFPKLDFNPIFFVLDRGQCRVLAAKKIDRYEVKGMYLEWDAAKKEWQIYHASLNNQAFNEYADRYDLTKEESRAVKFAVSMATTPKLTEEQCNHKYTAHYYIS